MAPRILIVDPDTDITRFVEVNLRLDGFECFVAHDLTNALQTLGRYPVDLVISEMMLRPLDGIEFVRRYRSDPVHATRGFMFLSAKSLGADKVMGLTAGADDYVIKPFDPLELVARVKNVLRLRSSQPVAVDGYSGLIDAAGSAVALETAPPQLIESVRSVGHDLLAELAERPELMYALAPDRFEEVVAALFEREGCESRVVGGSRDGGVDVVAVRRDEFGTAVYLVQCKLWHPRNRIGVSVVRDLYGVVEASNATAGIVATTSSFTRGAKSFQNQETVRARLSLHDYEHVVSWLRSSKRRIE